MSFSFSFTGDDIKEDEAENLDNDIYALNITNDAFKPNITARRWTLRELLETLPSQIAYNNLSLPGVSPTCSDAEQTARIKISRRSLFDIRAQLMAEANDDENDNESLLTGLDAGDLTSGLYEGGFKTWECAVDLAEYVSMLKLEAKGTWHVIELGAGSAIPSLVLLQKALTAESEDGQLNENARIRLTLCDYNEDVLKLCTGANVALTAVLAPPNTQSTPFESEDHSQDQDLDFETALPSGLSTIENALEQKGITVDFISGPWSPEFVDLLGPSSNNATALSSNIDEADVYSADNILILASETIYAPSFLDPFTTTLFRLLKNARASARALVAAKKIYFGVGGGTEEFERCAREAGGQVKVLRENKGSGVARVILEVSVSGSRQAG
jgi:protein-histidine N-methyltransferase